MNLTPVTTYLEQLGFGAQGSTIFINHFPAQVTTGILLRPRLTGAKHDYNLPGYLKFDFQVIVRAPLYDSAQELAIQVAKALKMNDAEMAPWTVKYMRAIHVPVGYPISLGEQVEFNTDIEACVVDDTYV